MFLSDSTKKKNLIKDFLFFLEYLAVYVDLPVGRFPRVCEQHVNCEDVSVTGRQGAVTRGQLSVIKLYEANYRSKDSIRDNLISIVRLGGPGQWTVRPGRVQLI